MSPRMASLKQGNVLVSLLQSFTGGRLRLQAILFAYSNKKGYSHRSRCSVNLKLTLRLKPVSQLERQSGLPGSFREEFLLVMGERDFCSILIFN